MKPAIARTGPARVLIATPTASGDVSARYMVSVMALLEELGRRSVEAHLATHRGGWVALARNILAMRAVSEGYSHLWFIDGDESFPVSSAMKLWDAKSTSNTPDSRAIVGAFYPSKIANWELAAKEMVLAAAIRGPRRGDEIRKTVLRQSWVRQELGPVGEDDVVQVDWLPTGFLLIATDALREMREQTPALAYFDRRYGASHAWFTNALLPTYGDLVKGEKLTGTDYCGEDVTFSRLWRKLGGKLWEVKNVEIEHEGRTTF